MRLSKAIKNYVKKREGFHAEVYKDVAGKATIGYGHLVKGITLTYVSAAIGRQITSLEGIKLTKPQANKLLELDLSVFVSSTNYLLKSRGIKITQPMFDALVSFAFNLGIGNLRSSTLLRKVAEGDIEEAARQFLRWKYAGGKVIQGILNRRIEEMNIFLTKDIIGDIIVPTDLTRVKDRDYINQLIAEYRGDLYGRR